MLTLALAALLAADDEVPLLPPPLVPAETQPEERRPLAVPDGYVPEPPAEVEQASTDGDFSASRVAVTGSVAGATGALLVGAGLFALYNLHDGGGSTGALLLLASLPASLFLGTGLAYAAHHAMGGSGGYGAHLGGGAIGGAIGLLITALVATQLHGDPGIAAEAGGVMALGALFGMGSALMGELSSYRTYNESHARVSVMPTRGGAVAVAGFGF